MFIYDRQPANIFGYLAPDYFSHEPLSVANRIHHNLSGVPLCCLLPHMCYEIRVFRCLNASTLFNNRLLAQSRHINHTDVFQDAQASSFELVKHHRVAASDCLACAAPFVF